MKKKKKVPESYIGSMPEGLTFSAPSKSSPTVMFDNGFRGGFMDSFASTSTFKVDRAKEYPKDFWMNMCEESMASIIQTEIAKDLSRDIKDIVDDEGGDFKLSMQRSPETLTKTCFGQCVKKDMLQPDHIRAEFSRLKATIQMHCEPMTVRDWVLSITDTTRKNFKKAYEKDAPGLFAVKFDSNFNKLKDTEIIIHDVKMKLRIVDEKFFGSDYMSLSGIIDDSFIYESSHTDDSLFPF